MVLQRYEVIAPLLNRPLPRGVRDVILDELAGTLHYDADGRLITVGKRTIERHLASYLKLGLEGLKPQVRQEQGSLKAFPPEALGEAVKIREARPELSADSIIEELRSAEIPGCHRCQYPAPKTQLSLPLNPAQVTGLRLLALPDSVTWQV